MPTLPSMTKAQVAVSITAGNLTALQQQLSQLAAMTLRHSLLLEWRLDYWQDWSSLTSGRRMISEQLPSVPLVATLRTQAAGGKVALTAAAYQQQLSRILPQIPATYWDVQWAATDAVFRRTLRQLAPTDQRFIWSHHSLQPTSYLQNLTILRKMATTAHQVDYLKLAVTSTGPATNADLLTATWQAAHELTSPLITMAMGTAGQSTRLLGPLFGSQVSFGALTTTSAPGQLPLTQLDQILLDDLFLRKDHYDTI